MSTTRLLNRGAAGLLAALTVSGAVLGGVWVAGGVLSDDFKTSMALTAAWFAISGAASVLVAWRRPAIRLAVLASYAVTAAAVGGYLGLTTLRDRVVDERVVTAAPSTERRDPTTKRRPAAVALARARFRSHEHATTGTATVVRLANGRRFVTLTSFATSPGPDLRVRLTPGGSIDGGDDGAIDLGALKGNRGDQQYAVPAGAAVAGRTVLIWCRAFSAPFGSARLRATA